MAVKMGSQKDVGFRKIDFFYWNLNLKSQYHRGYQFIVFFTFLDICSVRIPDSGSNFDHSSTSLIIPSWRKTANTLLFGISEFIRFNRISDTRRYKHLVNKMISLMQNSRCSKAQCSKLSLILSDVVLIISISFRYVILVIFFVSDIFPGRRTEQSI